ncbi:MAG TPA: tyrosine-type recombinase/integrase [Opitutaceae bacterium]
MSVASPIPESAIPAFLEAARRSGPRDYALALAGISWGFRITELLSIRVGDAADASGRIRTAVTVTRANLKFGQSARRKSIRSRTVPVGETLRAALGDYLSSRFGSGPFDAAAPLFAGRFPGEPLCRRHAQRLVQSFALAAGLPLDRTWSTHTLRKTYGKAVYTASGFDIIKTQRALGHADCQTTQRYLPMEDSEIQATIEAAQARFTAPTTEVRTPLRVLV